MEFFAASCIASRIVSSTGIGTNYDGTLASEVNW